MTNNLFMIDIETTGTDIKTDEILQITIVQMTQRPDGLYKPGKVFNDFYHTDRVPTSLFAKEHQQELYKKCNDLPRECQESAKSRLKDYLKDCGCEGPVAVFCGQNASSFDVPFLVEKGLLEPCSYKNINGVETKVGDFSYRIYELSGLLYAFCDAYGNKDRNEVINSAIDFDKVIPMPEGNRHDGLVDCLRQMKMLNGLLAQMRQRD